MQTSPESSGTHAWPSSHSRADYSWQTISESQDRVMPRHQSSATKRQQTDLVMTDSNILATATRNTGQINVTHASTHMYMSSMRLSCSIYDAAKNPDYSVHECVGLDYESKQISLHHKWTYRLTPRYSCMFRRDTDVYTPCRHPRRS